MNNIFRFIFWLLLITILHLICSILFGYVYGFDPATTFVVLNFFSICFIFKGREDENEKRKK